ncbi:MAG: asparagine synthase (glutamine-hydrolyzing) [Methylococcales bacterium]
MCGLVGFLGGVALMCGDEALLRSMTDTIIHRGPNDSGVWCHSEQRIGLGHRRLAIVDLSPAGHQPMVSNLERYVIAFNGEIYNHLNIRTELEVLGLSPVWRGHSDTETLLAGIEAWGLEATLKKAIGMFAIALWDRQTMELTLARDRMGEKPLYYGWQGDGVKRVFLFGSELKALKAHPAFMAEIDRGALCLLMRHNYIPAPYSIYQGIAKLEPGCLLTVSLTQPKPRILKYWSALEAARAGVAKPFAGTADEAVVALEVLVKDAVRQQMVADVPLGAFLSGGIDSSTVVALMQVQSSRPVKTFTIGFNEEGYSEAVHAKTVAQHLGTEHTELYVSPQQAMGVILELPSLYCEPFADSSQIPTFLVNQLAKQQVTVSLSGDAGDELFCGYKRYQLTANLWKQLSIIPRPLRSMAAKGITAISPQTWNRYTDFFPWTSVGDKLHKGAAVITSASSAELYLGMVSSWSDPAALVVGAIEPPTLLIGNSPLLLEFSEIQRMMMLDTITYLPDDILVKVDRAAMGNSLECRVPFLDHRVVEFAWSLPMKYKLRGVETKWALRQVLYRHVPSELIERPKMGFGLPIDKWLRGLLRDWAEELLNEQRLQHEGFFHPRLIRQKWAEHLSGSRNWSSQLWGVLMFQAWLEQERRG